MRRSCALGRWFGFCILVHPLWGAVPFDGLAVRPGPVTLKATGDLVTVQWNDEANRPWSAEFSLDPKAPLIRSIRMKDLPVIESARPFYECTTGKRRGGWDQFFDLPPSHPEGTRSFAGVFNLTRARAASVGDRVELTFEGMHMGLFEGALRYV